MCNWIDSIFSNMKKVKIEVLIQEKSLSSSDFLFLHFLLKHKIENQYIPRFLNTKLIKFTFYCWTSPRIVSANLGGLLYRHHCLTR